MSDDIIESIPLQVPLKSNSLLLNADFCDAIDKFQEGLFLEADDVVENCFKTKQNKSNKVILNAFRYILHDSLDPSEKEWDEAQSYAKKMKKPKSFNDSILCWASFLSFASKNEFPSITKRIAELFLSYKDISSSTVEGLLEIGRYRAKKAIDEARNKIQSPTSVKPSKDIEVEGTVQKDWINISKQDPNAPTVVNEVLSMTGLNEIKQALIDQYNRIRIAQRQGDAAASSYNVRFEGNPGTGKSFFLSTNTTSYTVLFLGTITFSCQFISLKIFLTGKTTIARHYSTFLQQLTVLPENSITFDVTAASLKNKGISYLEELLDKVKEAGGGVVFIDEAYQLGTDQIGGKIIDFILPICESLDGQYGKLVWIFAGYPKEMEKLFEHNVGLPSRFPQRFIFIDYNAVQMESIFQGFMKFKEAKSDESDSKKKQDQQKATKISVPRYLTSRNYRRNAYDSTDGEIYNDRFGNSWTCDTNKGLWLDKYGNSTGYYPDDIGTEGNPLASKSETWTHDGRSWMSNNGDKQNHYPGSPDPKKKSKKDPRNPPFTCVDDKFLRIAMRRLERQSNRPGFGNARTVRNTFDTVRKRQAKRISKENRKGRRVDDFLFTKDDLLGIVMDESQLKTSDAYIKLQKMEGLKPVKEQIDLLIKLGASNLKREESERPLLDVILNRVFLGNPGTVT